MIENVLISVSLPEFSNWQGKIIPNVYQMLLAPVGHGTPGEEQEPLHPSRELDVHTVKPNHAPSDTGTNSDEGKIIS